MSTVHSQITVNAPVERVWAALADFGGIARYAANVTRSHALGEQNAGVGAQRRCDFDTGNYAVEQITRWDEGRSYTLEITETDTPVKAVTATLAVAPDGDGVRVSATVDYALKFGVLGALMDVLVARRQYQRVFDDLLFGLKHHVETGEAVTPEVLARARSAQQADPSFA